MEVHTGGQSISVGRSVISKSYEPLLPHLRRLLCLFLVLPLFSSCVATKLIPTSVHPVVKIGLLAPFEGLHRRNGYEALAAMRLALDTYTGHAITVIPLAVHIDSPHGVDDRALANENSGALRTVRKLLADPDVRAVVGPYDPRLVAQIQPMMREAEMAWFLPHAVDPTAPDPASAFVGQRDTDEWAITLVQEVATQAARQGANRLVLAGWQPGWPSPLILEESGAPLPIVVIEEPMRELAAITTADAIFWLGSLEVGVTYLTTIRERSRGIPFWFGQSGGEPVLAELLSNQLTFDSSNVYWVTWLDAYYLHEVDFGRSDVLAPDTVAKIRSLSPTAYLTFRATQAAVASLDPTYVPATADWHVIHFALQADGTSHRLGVSR